MKKQNSEEYFKQSRGNVNTTTSNNEGAVKKILIGVVVGVIVYAVTQGF